MIRLDCPDSPLFDILSYDGRRGSDLRMTRKVYHGLFVVWWSSCQVFLITSEKHLVRSSPTGFSVADGDAQKVYYLLHVPRALGRCPRDLGHVLRHCRYLWSQSSLFGLEKLPQRHTRGPIYLSPRETLVSQDT